jgi:hypothetical protein
MSTTAEILTIGELLAQHGWQPEADPAFWWRDTPAGPATLTRTPGTGLWDVWEMHGGNLPTGGSLVANAALAGPGKMCRDNGGGFVWRYELPRSATDTHDGETLDAWVQDVTAVAVGAPVEPPPVDSTALAARLEKDGWPATAVDGVVRVSVALQGLFRAITIDGAMLQCELSDFESVDPVCRQAALHLAETANDRVRLGRFALHTEGPAGKLFAEVHTGSTGVSGIAVESLHAAIALTARELAALRGDRELADTYLAAHAAGEEGMG